MKLFFKYSKLLVLPLFIALSSLVSCGTMHTVSQNNDGIYDDETPQQPKVTTTHNTVANNDNYFTKEVERLGSLNGTDIFTDIENYASEDFIAEEENNQEEVQTRINYNEPWGYNNTSDVVVIHHNTNPRWGWGYNGFYNPYWNTAWGWNNWRWRNSWNRWGWNTWHPYHWNSGLYIGLGWNNYYCPPYYRNNYYYGNRFYRNRTPYRRYNNSRYYAQNSRRANASRRSYNNSYNRSNKSYRSNRRGSSNSRSYTPSKRRNNSNYSNKNHRSSRRNSYNNSRSRSYSNNNSSSRRNYSNSSSRSSRNNRSSSRRSRR